MDSSDIASRSAAPAPSRHSKSGNAPSSSGGGSGFVSLLALIGSNGGSQPQIPSDGGLEGQAGEERRQGQRPLGLPGDLLKQLAGMQPPDAEAVEGESPSENSAVTLEISVAEPHDGGPAEAEGPAETEGGEAGGVASGSEGEGDDKDGQAASNEDAAAGSADDEGMTSVAAGASQPQAIMPEGHQRSLGIDGRADRAAASAPVQNGVRVSAPAPVKAAGNPLAQDLVNEAKASGTRSANGMQPLPAGEARSLASALRPRTSLFGSAEARSPRLQQVPVQQSAGGGENSTPAPSSKGTAGVFAGEGAQQFSQRMTALASLGEVCSSPDAAGSRGHDTTIDDVREAALRDIQRLEGSRADGLRAAPEVPRHAPPPVARQVASTIVRELREGGDGPVRELRIALRPEKLGRVDVRIEMKDDVIRASVRADNPQALDMLRSDARALEQALREAGLKLDGAIEFLAQDGQKERGGQDGKPAQAASLNQEADDDPGAATEAQGDQHSDPDAEVDVVI